MAVTGSHHEGHPKAFLNERLPAALASPLGGCCCAQVWGPWAFHLAFSSASFSNHPQHSLPWATCREAATCPGHPELEAGWQPDTCQVALKRVIVTLHRNARQGGLAAQEETPLCWLPFPFRSLWKEEGEGGLDDLGEGFLACPTMARTMIPSCIGRDICICAGAQPGSTATPSLPPGEPELPQASLFRILCGSML